MFFLPNRDIEKLFKVNSFKLKIAKIVKLLVYILFINKNKKAVILKKYIRNFLYNSLFVFNNYKNQFNMTNYIIAFIKKSIDLGSLYQNQKGLKIFLSYYHKKLTTYSSNFLIINILTVKGRIKLSCYYNKNNLSKITNKLIRSFVFTLTLSVIKKKKFKKLNYDCYY